jgi:hypothetical protein
MIISRVHVIDDLATEGFRIIVKGRMAPGERGYWLRADGDWEEITEGSITDPHAIGFTVPEGVLEEVVAQFLKIKPTNTATQDHLEDALEVRNRLLAMIEKRTP